MILKDKYISGIDGLRAIAVLSVVLFHAGFEEILPGGYIGVDIFLVISGFLITRLIINEIKSTGKFQYSNFYYRRCKRLFPALFFTLILSFFAAFLLFSAPHFQRFGGSLVYSSMSLSNFFFWTEAGYFDTSSEFKPLLHLWSLSIEEQFYLIWPLFLVFFFRSVVNKYSVIAIVLVTALSLGSSIVMADGKVVLFSEVFPALESWFNDGPATIFYLLPFRVFEFGIGALVIWALYKPAKKNITLELSMAMGLSLICYSIIKFDKFTLFPSYNALFPCIGAALVIYSTKAKYLGLIVRNKLLISIGLISYSMYLCHWPIIVFYKYYNIYPLSFFEQILIVMASIIIGALMYRYIEQPFRNHSPDRNGSSRAGFGLASALPLMLLVFFASSVWANSGWVWRIPELPKGLAEQLKDSGQFHVDNYGGKRVSQNDWITHARKEEAVDLLVLGDSHARHYGNGLEQLIGKQESKNIYSLSISCLLLPDIARTTPGTDWKTDCPKYLSSAVDIINKNPGSVLFLAHSWFGQIPISEDMTTGKSNKSVEDILPKITKLKSLIAGHSIILVGDVPGARTSDVIGCFMRPGYFPVNCDKILSLQENTLYSYKLNNVFRQYASTIEGIYFMNPHDAMCRKGACFTFSDGKVLYSDSSHLSLEGSLYVVKHFKSQIQKIMQNTL